MQTTVRPGRDTTSFRPRISRIAIHQTTPGNGADHGLTPVLLTDAPPYLVRMAVLERTENHGNR